jgi:hypothetical protein
MINQESERTWHGSVSKTPSIPAMRQATNAIQHTHHSGSTYEDHHILTASAVLLGHMTKASLRRRPWMDAWRSDCFLGPNPSISIVQTLPFFSSLLTRDAPNRALRLAFVIFLLRKTQGMAHGLDWRQGLRWNFSHIIKICSPYH